MTRALICTLLATLLVACGGGSAVPPQPDYPDPPPGEPPGTSPTQVLVKPVSALALEQVLVDLGGTLLDGVTGTLWHKIRVPAGSTPAGYVTQLEADARVLAAALDVGLAAPEGDGRTIPAGGALLSVDLPLQTDLARIGIEAAQARASGGGVDVAVLDTGVVFDHEFLQGRLLPGGRDFVDDDMDPGEERNGLDDDGNGFVDEGFGHGTFTTSLVLAVAPGAAVLPLRVLGTDLFGTSSGVAAAIGYAANQGVSVIHMSVDLPGDVEVVRDAIQSARALGIAVIGSAGNTGAEDVGAAEAGAGAFLVAAVDGTDAVARFASHGSGVALSAPGVDVHGAFPVPPGSDTDTAIWSGSSFSAPLVTGAYALLRELFPLSTPDDLLLRLQARAHDIDGTNPGYAGKLGAGRLDLDAATAP